MGKKKTIPDHVERYDCGCIRGHEMCPEARRLWNEYRYAKGRTDRQRALDVYYNHYGWDTSFQGYDTEGATP